jgi:Cys-tRNA(Pro) deacylase
MEIATPGTRALEGSHLSYEIVQTSVPQNAAESASLQGIRLEQLVRTIVVRRGADDYILVLVPGGRQIDWPRLRAHLGVSRLSLPDESEAKEATGYERGAITPLGSARAWPVVADRTVLDADRIAIGAGRRGVNLHMHPRDLISHLGAEIADITRPDS